MKRSMTVLALPALFLLGAGVAGQEAAREAAWSLKFTHGPLEVHSVTYKDGSARSFYYLTFKLENKSQTEADLALYMKAAVGSHPKKRREFIAKPEPDAEESVRRLARAPDLKNVSRSTRWASWRRGARCAVSPSLARSVGNGTWPT